MKPKWLFYPQIELRANALGGVYSQIFAPPHSFHVSLLLGQSAICVQTRRVEEQSRPELVFCTCLPDSHPLDVEVSWRPRRSPYRARGHGQCHCIWQPRVLWFGCSRKALWQGADLLCVAFCPADRCRAFVSGCKVVLLSWSKLSLFLAFPFRKTETLNLFDANKLVVAGWRAAALKSVYATQKNT